MEEEEQPCWARGTKFTLSCSFKTTAGQAGRVDAPPPPLALEPGRWWTACPREEDTAQGHTAQPERYRGSGLKEQYWASEAMEGRPARGQRRRLSPRAPPEAGMVASSPRATAAPQCCGSTRALSWVRRTTRHCPRLEPWV